MIEASEMPAMPSPLLSYVIGGLGQRLDTQSINEGSNSNPEMLKQKEFTHNIAPKLSYSTTDSNKPITLQYGFGLSSNKLSNDGKSEEGNINSVQTFDLPNTGHGTVSLIESIHEDHVKNSGSDVELNNTPIRTSKPLNSSPANGNSYNKLNRDATSSPPNLSPLTIPPNINAGKDHVNNAYSGISIKHLIEGHLNPNDNKELENVHVNLDPVYEQLMIPDSNTQMIESSNLNTIEEIHSSVNNMKSNILQHSLTNEKVITINSQNLRTDPTFIIGRVGTSVENIISSSVSVLPVDKENIKNISFANGISNYSSSASQKNSTKNNPIVTSQNKTKNGYSDVQKVIQQIESSTQPQRQPPSKNNTDSDAKTDTTSDIEEPITESSLNPIDSFPEESNSEKHTITNSSTTQNIKTIDLPEIEHKDYSDSMMKRTNSENAEVKLGRFDTSKTSGVTALDSLEELRLMNGVKKIVQSLKYDPERHPNNQMASILTTTKMSYLPYPSPVAQSQQSLVRDPNAGPLELPIANENCK